MSIQLTFEKISPTVFLTKSEKGLQQLIKITVSNSEDVQACSISAIIPGKEKEIQLGCITKGKSEHEIYIDEILKEANVEFTLKYGDMVTDKRTLHMSPVKHWTVHVVQLSHHDPGYTDLPSVVIAEHDELLSDALKAAEKTKNYPEEAKFRIVIEQAWSLDHFMNNAAPEKVEQMAALLQSGQFEATALFGNMTTELCGHEVMSRMLYHSFRLKRKYGIPIASAEHNDITGISWGLSRVLTDAGVKIFCPGIPLYYNWSKLSLQSFWDEKAIFPHGGPGAFWWEAPSGKRILFWCNNSGCGGDFHANMPTLADRLLELNGPEYPYSIMRWPVGGGSRDNSPYIVGYADTIKNWNERWAFPRLISSTNTMFYNDFIKVIPSDLPVFRGEIAGQDYPAGATSTAEATAANRNNHSDMITAEKFSTAAAMLTDYKYRDDLIFKTYENMLWHDEHAWGYHFPCGPAMKASEYEKALTAYKAASHVYELIRKSTAKLADNIAIKEPGFHLVVFNSTDYSRTGPVNAIMREIDNSGTEMTYVAPEDDDKGVGYLRGTLLNNRWPAHPPIDLVEGKFELVDMETGKSMDYQIIPVDAQDNPVPFAAQRVGLGQGSNRYGYFEIPLGLRHELCFIAENVPALGYKTYRLVAKDTAPSFGNGLMVTDNSIENKFYRITADIEKGMITSIYDKSADYELIDGNCPHGFGTMIVREPGHAGEFHSESLKACIRLQGPICASIEITGSIYGHPAFTHEIKLFEGMRNIHVGTRVLKDATPLLDAHMAFPFRMKSPEFRYEGPLCVMTPIKDYMPGSYSDTIAVQNWVKVTDGSFNILWSGLDAPIAGFSGLWPGYVSPAHRCVLDESAAHPPLRPEDLTNGWIYSNMFHNNFGTNFSVSQVGNVLFRYVISTCEGDVSDSIAAKFGWEAVCNFQQVFVNQPGKGSLPLSGSFMKISNEKVVSLVFKKAEDGNGYIVRLWNMSENTENVTVMFDYLEIKKAMLVSPAEEDRGTIVNNNSESFELSMSGQSVAAVRILV